MGIRTNASRRSWTISHGHVTRTSENMSSGISAWDKFRLLLWKNSTQSLRNRVQTVTEILLPLVFTAVLLIVRNVVPSTFITEPTIYKPLILERRPPETINSNCDKIYYTPVNPTVDALMQKVNSQYFLALGLEYNFTGFSSEEELVQAYIQSANNSAIINSTADFEPIAPVLAGVVFTNKFVHGTFPKDIEYKLRFPATQRTQFDISERFGGQPVWYTELIYPLFQFLGPRGKDHIGGGLPGYHEEGFLYLQYAIDRTLTRELLNTTELENYNKYNIQLQRYPYPPFIDDKYLLALQGWLPLIIMMSFIYPAINITKSIVYEKEKRLKEYMKIMGVPNFCIWTAWFIKSYAFLIVSSGLMTLMLKAEYFSIQNLAIFPQADGYVVFLVFLVFSFSLICFSFFISSLFSRSNAGATAAGVLWFITYVPYGFLRPRYNLLPRKTKLISCFLTNMGISFAMQIICIAEGTGAGIKWNNIFQASGPDDDFSMGDCLIMMFANGVFYMISAIYIEAIRPGEFGVPLPFYFLFTKSFWTGKSKRFDAPNLEIESSFTGPNMDLFEGVLSTATPGVQIIGLTKIYDNAKVAIRNLSLNFYQGEITAFLGHNGAGKTTTMSILSGLFPPTSGTALINNFDIRNDISAARGSFGLCPQYDVLFDELTVEEHLRFYCRIKGCKASNLPGEINRMIKALGLEDKRHAQSHTLSGGMKRKLSILVAFCGGSKVVLLDEPTSGMDVGSRRSTWDLIQSEKNGRTIIFNTHFMEEADVLSDRIAIMANGEIECYGTSLFLKKKYGGGYHLIIVKDESCDVDKVTKVIQKSIPEVEIDQDVGAELSYSLPDEKSELFSELFEELEKNKNDLGIASYGASNTTMEEVFIRVGQQVDARMLAQHRQEVPKQSTNLAIDNNQFTTDSKTHLYIDEPPRNVGVALKLQQFRAMVTKKLIYASRNRILLFSQMGIPLLYLVLILIVVKNYPGISDSSPHKFTLKRYEKVGSTITSIKCPIAEPICQSYKSFVTKNNLIELVSQNESFIEFILEKEQQDLVSVNFRYIVGFDQRKVKESDKDHRSLVGFFNNQPLHAPPLSLNFISNAVLFSKNYSITITNHPFPVGSIDALKKAGTFYTLGFQIGNNIALGMSFLAASFVVFIITEKESRSKHIQFVSGLEFPLYWIASFVLDFIQFIIPCFGVMAILFLFQIEEFVTIHMQLHLLLLFVCYGLGVIPLMYLASFSFTIPSSGFTRLVLFNIFTGMAPILTVVIIQTPEFQLETLADTLNSIFLILPNYALGMGIVQLSTNYQFARDCLRFNLEYLCPVSPSFVCCSKLKPNFLDWERIGIGKNIGYLLVSCCIYFVILFVWESRIWMKLKKWNFKSSVKNSDAANETMGLEDVDVLEEKKKMNDTDLTQLFNDNTLVVRNLTKYYGNFLAVDHINLGVQRGECFGLLGVNGAGKTSTFKMLTGDLSISEGEAYVCSRSVRRDLKHVHEVLGYCPQFDALIEEMTGKETLQLYARLRGIQESYIEHLTHWLGETLLFSQFMDKRVGSYSGGNRRKLSTAISLIGSPPIIFLDEMTTGMDPVARRQMWTAISKIRDSGTSIILTSHSMSECEALCTRLAIMVNGTFRCLGSPQQLKNKFGQGYQIIAQTAPKGINESDPFTREKQELGRRRSSLMSMRQLKSSSRGWESELEGLRSFIEESYPGSQLKDIHPGFVHYQIPSQGVTWGALFRKMEIAKEKFSLEAYSVGQCTLEQIFLAFTKAQFNSE